MKSRIIQDAQMPIRQEHAYLCDAICEAAADFMIRPTREQFRGQNSDGHDQLEYQMFELPSLVQVLNVTMTSRAHSYYGECR